MTAMTAIQFNRHLELRPDEADEPFPGIRRVMADNPGPFTFKGTVTYIIGRGHVAVLDPGPDDPRHVEAVLNAVRGETVTHIFVTHTHLDHSPAVVALKEATGATVYAEGPHRASRPLQSSDITRPADRAFRPDIALKDGDVVMGHDWSLEAITTPGHTVNHMAFALAGTNVLFSGDHVMGWSSTIVAPPDGSMTDFVASLEKLSRRKETLFFPGHGPPIENATAFVPLLIEHRRERERSILDQLRRGASTVAGIVDGSYGQIDERLIPAARMTVLAHLEDLTVRGLVLVNGFPSLNVQYKPAGSNSTALSGATGRFL